MVGAGKAGWVPTETGLVEGGQGSGGGGASVHQASSVDPTSRALPRLPDQQPWNQGPWSTPPSTRPALVGTPPHPTGHRFVHV